MSTMIGLEARCRTTEQLKGPTDGMYREWGEQMLEFVKLSEIASFVLSNRAYRTLMNLRRTKDVENPWSEEQTERLKGHLAILRGEAKKDLGYGDLGDDEETVAVTDAAAFPEAPEMR
jgi:hypothetical protein